MLPSDLRIAAIIKIGRDVPSVDETFWYLIQENSCLVNGAGSLAREACTPPPPREGKLKCVKKK